MHKWEQNNVQMDAVNRSEYQFEQHDKYRLTKYKIIIVIRNAENGSNIKSNAVLSRIMEIHCRFNSEFSKHNKYTRIETPGGGKRISDASKCDNDGYKCYRFDFDT